MRDVDDRHPPHAQSQDRAHAIDDLYHSAFSLRTHIESESWLASSPPRRPGEEAKSRLTDEGGDKVRWNSKTNQSTSERENYEGLSQGRGSMKWGPEVGIGKTIQRYALSTDRKRGTRLLLLQRR